MKKHLIMLTIVVFIFAVVGCGKRDAEYFKNHPAEMKQKIEECSKMSQAEKLADRECVAINQANSDKFFKSTVQRPGEGQGRGTKQF